MKTLIPSKTLSRVEVTYISTHGLWLLTNSSELFVSFADFPQFRNISSIKLKHVAQLHSDILYWPDLNIEIPVKRIRCFPLVSAKPYPTRRSARQAKTRSGIV
ncbi:MAG: DUF2442 domain-containing protein [Nitrospira sp.]|nr:DUF2442 domain-containing protein [Nitrospira sp.]MDH4303931.1 DUF2442 domain-containing protein [Nitrospira sp.]MDH5193847.1 DUF2442 domain-containing protein [Nitrospira sp.]